jgi:CheY-like chemotaxis protein
LRCAFCYVLDVMLPLVDGFTVCRTIRQNGCAVPGLMLTARDSIDARIQGLDCGADDYLMKPFDSTNCWRGFVPSSVAARSRCFRPSSWSIR